MSDTTEQATEYKPLPTPGELVDQIYWELGIHNPRRSRLCRSLTKTLDDKGQTVTTIALNQNKLAPVILATPLSQLSRAFRQHAITAVGPASDDPGLLVTVDNIRKLLNVPTKVRLSDHLLGMRKSDGPEISPTLRVPGVRFTDETLPSGTTTRIRLTADTEASARALSIGKFKKPDSSTPTAKKVLIIQSETIGEGPEVFRPFENGSIRSYLMSWVDPDNGGSVHYVTNADAPPPGSTRSATIPLFKMSGEFSLYTDGKRVIDLCRLNRDTGAAPVSLEIFCFPPVDDKGKLEDLTKLTGDFGTTGSTKLPKGSTITYNVFGGKHTKKLVDYLKKREAVAAENMKANGVTMRIVPPPGYKEPETAPNVSTEGNPTAPSAAETENGGTTVSD